MSVATQLGLTDPDTDLLGLARVRWAQWAGVDERLAVTDDLTGLPAWIAAADPAQADRVLLALAKLGSPTGGDDLAAAGALVWLLVPGASVIAHRLRTLTPRIDEVVAAQLWMEARTFGWQRGHKVAANILANTRKGVLRDLGVGEHLRTSDSTWFRTRPVAPDALLWNQLSSAPDDVDQAARDLVDVLAEAIHQGLVTTYDCALLLRLAEAADAGGTRGSRRGQQGLMTPTASQAVAADLGVSARTVRRRAAKTLDVLSRSCPIPA